MRSKLAKHTPPDPPSASARVRERTHLRVHARGVMADDRKARDMDFVSLLLAEAEARRQLIELMGDRTVMKIGDRTVRRTPSGMLVFDGGDHED